MAKDKNLKKMKKLKKEVNKTQKEWNEMKAEMSTFMNEFYKRHETFEEKRKKLHDDIERM